MTDLQGRCGGCGYLAKRPSHPYSGLFEISERERASPLLALQSALQPENVGGIVWDFVCHRQAADLLAEIGRQEDHADTAARAKKASEVFEKDRRCPEFMPYVPGWSPQRHMDVELDQRAHQRMMTLTRRLTHVQIVAAIIVGVILAVATANPGSPLYEGLRWLFLRIFTTSGTAPLGD